MPAEVETTVEDPETEPAAPAAASEQAAGKPAIIEPARIDVGFDGEKEDSTPAWIRVAETSGKGHPASWRVLHDASAPSPPHAFGTGQNPNTGSIHNLALFEGSKFDDVDVFLQVKALGGTENRGGGPVWRVTDADNYYAARWNPLIDDIRLYRVVDGKRHQISGIAVEADHEVWHEFRLVMVGSEIGLWFDGKRVMTVEDSTITGPGQVGMWTDGDADSMFDGFSARPATAMP